MIGLSTALIDLIISNIKLLLIAGTLAGVALWGYQHGTSSTQAEWELRWSKRDSQDMAAQAKRESDERAEEQRRQTTINQISSNAQRELDEKEKDLAVARSSVERLQRTIRTLRNPAAGSAAGCVAGTAGSGTTGADTCVLLADLLSESIERSRQLAAEADRLRIVATTCERSYDAMRNRGLLNVSKNRVEPGAN